jgi:cell division initiation protein
VKITPLDIQQQQFKGKLFGGLHPDEVDSFLQSVAQELENLNRENAGLREQSQKAAAEAEILAQREKDLRETILAAQKITEEMKGNARKEADLIIAEARVQADRIVAEAENRLIHLNNEIQDLRRQKAQYTASFRGLLESHGKILAVDEE